MIDIIKTQIRLCCLKSFGGGSAPKAPPPPAPPPTETSADVAQEQDVKKKRMFSDMGRSSTILTRRTNPSTGMNKSKLGQ